MSWQRFFQNYILERGFNYFIDDCVISLNKENDYLSAQVIGTEMYEVEVVFDDEKVLAFDCTCPYAAENNFCKHMAAVMFAYEKNQTNVTKIEHTKSFEEVVDLAEDGYIRQFLIDLFSENSSLFNQFIVGQQTAISSLDLEYLKTELHDIFDDHLYPDNFIAYHDAWDFQYAIENFMDRIIKVMLIQNGHYQEAFELINLILLELYDLAIDDSGGTLTMIASECFELWEMILESTSEDFQGEMFAWFTQIIESKDLDFLDEYIENIFISHFNDEMYLEKKREVIKNKLEKSLSKKINHDWNYEYNKWAFYYLQTLEPFERLREEQQAFIDENIDVKSVREFYIDKLITAENLETAIHLIEEGLASEKLKGLLSKEYHENLKVLYYKTGQEKAYQKSLFELVCNYGAHRMDLYEEYKAQFNRKEWLEKRSSIIQSVTVWNGQDELLHKEEMFEELLQLALSTSGLRMIQKYEEILGQMNSEKVLDKYEQELLEIAETTSNRKTYRFIAQTIRQMKRIPNSSLCVTELLSYFRTTYKNRPAMMDELSHL